jgi:FkbM family methyltransferase
MLFEQKNDFYLHASACDMENILCPLAQTLDKPNFKERYLKLIRGLDDKSIMVVQKALSRLQRAVNGVQILADENETKILKDLRVNMQNNIIKTGDVFAYMGYFLPVNNFDPSVFYYRLHIDALQTTAKIKHKDIIDAGAWAGDSALILSKYTDKKVFAFEPVPQIYNWLLKTVEMNNLENVVPINVGVGDKDERRSMYLQGFGSSFVRHIEPGCSTANDIEVTTIDGFVEKNNLQVGLIKADIEGFEQYMLRGAEKTIKSQRPALMICIYHNESDFFDIKPLIESWNLDYKFKIVKGVDGNIFSETLLIAEVL